MKEIIIKIYNKYREHDSEIRRVTNRLFTLLGELILINQLAKFKILTPFVFLIKIFYRWSLYTTLLALIGNCILAIFHFQFSIPYFVTLVSGLISAVYMISIELDYEMIVNSWFSIANEYNKILAKIIVKLQNLPEKTEDVINKIKRLKSMFINIPINKINHEVMSTIPSEIKDKVIIDITNDNKEQIDYYYIELEKMMDPEYRKNKFREYLKDEISKKYSHLVSNNISTNFSINNLSSYLNWNVAINVISLVLVAAGISMFPDEVKMIKEKVNETLKITNFFRFVYAKIRGKKTIYSF